MDVYNCSHSRMRLRAGVTHQMLRSVGDLFLDPVYIPARTRDCLFLEHVVMSIYSLLSNYLNSNAILISTDRSRPTTCGNDSLIR